MTTKTATIIETATVKTRQGDAELFKAWNAETKTLASLWSDCSKPNPFLKGKAIGDTVEFLEEVREEVDMNGKTVSKTYYTVLPC